MSWWWWWCVVTGASDQSRIFYFSAETSADMDDWINIIEQVLQQTKRTSKVSFPLSFFLF